VSDGPADPDALARRAAQFIAEGTGIAEHDVAIVLGSGWAPAVAALGSATAVLPMAELPGFTPPTAVGHTGPALYPQAGRRRDRLTCRAASECKPRREAMPAAEQIARHPSSPIGRVYVRANFS
jgi:purine nucleoside phosphorylase